MVEAPGVAGPAVILRVMSARGDARAGELQEGDIQRVVGHALAGPIDVRPQRLGELRRPRASSSLTRGRCPPRSPRTSTSPRGATSAGAQASMASCPCTSPRRRWRNAKAGAAPESHVRKDQTGSSRHHAVNERIRSAASG